MTSYLSSLTSHYTTLKRLLPNSLSADSDLHINDPEDSHVSRVLRAYYTEKGRPFPPWLGPDPNAPVQAKPAYVQQSANGDNRYGQQQPAGGRMGNSQGRNAGGLGDLFDSPSSGPPPREEPLSLRARRPRPQQQSYPEPRAARPLPSQRPDSHQSRGNPSPMAAPYEQPPPASRELSAQERLKARLGGARANSPSANSAPADRASPNPYGRSGGGAPNPYNQPSRSGNPYGGSSNNPYGGGGGYGGAPKPVTSANAPWSSGDDGYGYGGGGGGEQQDAGGYGGRNIQRGPGLPSNPRRR